MMKVLRFIGILLLILAVGFLVLCMVSPKELKIERTTLINAPKSVVWEQIVKFKNWDNWSAWKEMDTTIVVDYTGTDGEVGSTYHYVSKRSGEGITTNTGLSDGEMKYAMDFKSPIPGAADGYYKVVEEAGKTKVIWYYHQDMGFFHRGGAAIFGAEKMLTSTFDRGLELLKNYSEAHASDAPAAGSDMAITDVQYEAHTYAGIRKNVTMADFQSFFSNALSVVGKEAGSRITGPAVSLIYTWNETNMSGDVLAGFPVAGNTPIKGATIVDVPASAGYKLVYVGPYGGFNRVHEAIGKHVSAAGKTVKLTIEEYIKGPNNETDSNKYETNIIYLVN